MTFLSLKLKYMYKGRDSGKYRVKIFLRATELCWWKVVRFLSLTFLSWPWQQPGIRLARLPHPCPLAHQHPASWQTCILLCSSTKFDYHCNNPHDSERFCTDPQIFSWNQLLFYYIILLSAFLRKNEFTIPVCNKEKQKSWQSSSTDRWKKFSLKGTETLGLLFFLQNWSWINSSAAYH